MRRDDRDGRAGGEQPVELARGDRAAADEHHRQPGEPQEHRIQRRRHAPTFRAACSPHSVLPAAWRQRPERSAAPGITADVHGAQPIDG